MVLQTWMESLMENCITFLAFSKNDIGGEKKRVNLFIESICSQDTDQWHSIYIWR